MEKVECTYRYINEHGRVSTCEEGKGEDGITFVERPATARCEVCKCCPKHCPEHFRIRNV